MVNENTFHIAILLCDETASQNIEKHGSYAEMFRRVIRKTQQNIDITTIRCHEGESLPAPDDFDAYIISGSKSSVYESRPWIETLKTFVRTCWQERIKMVGICFGHQLIAESLGGKTTKAKQGWGVGVHKVEITQPQSWMTTENSSAPSADHYKLVVIHQDQVNVLPDGFEIIATSEFCPISMMIGGDTMLGIQGHPEFSKEYCTERVIARRECIGETRYHEAMNSLQHFTTDADTVLRWIVNFLHAPQKSA